MSQIAFVTPTQWQYRQALWSTVFTSRNFGFIILIFIGAFAALWFLKLARSFFVKLLIALILVSVFVLYLYFNSSARIYF